MPARARSRPSGPGAGRAGGTRGPGLRLIAAPAAAIVLAVAGATAAGALTSQTGAKDVIIWTASNGTIRAPGNDTIYDRGGHNTILGGAGNNDIYPGPGDDVHGGPGVNAVLYANRTEPVNVTLDNQANDGAAGDGDNIHTDIEQIYGGSGDNQLIGDLAPNAPPETIVGGSGDNHIVGGSGHNHLYGGPGKDYINSFDGKVDVVVCGSGDGTAMADAFDVVINCKHRVPPPRITSPVLYTLIFIASPPVTTVSALSVSDIPSGGIVEIRCHGVGCPFAVKRPRLRSGQRQIELAGLLRGSRLHVGAQLELRITKPNVILKNAIGKVLTLTMQRDAAAAEAHLCLSPGSSTPARSC
jgi:Ca2+-binding RTX toxin-like protein